MKQLELLLIEKIEKNHLASFTPQQYNVPGRIEDPTITCGMLRQFLIDFHKHNEMPLPKYFYQRNYKQLLGMYSGMKKTGYFRRKCDI